MLVNGGWWEGGEMYGAHEEAEGPAEGEAHDTGHDGLAGAGLHRRGHLGFGQSILNMRELRRNGPI